VLLIVNSLSNKTNFERGLRLVAIGGGTGLSTLLSGLKQYVSRRQDNVPWLESLSAIVTVSDDGGSSGRLRDELQILPPGDIRNCMIALSEDSNLLSRLFRYRFGGSGDLAGHSFGNLFLTAMTNLTGDFAHAVRLSAEVHAVGPPVLVGVDADREVRGVHHRAGCSCWLVAGCDRSLVFVAHDSPRLLMSLSLALRQAGQRPQ